MRAPLHVALLLLVGGCKHAPPEPITPAPLQPVLELPSPTVDMRDPEGAFVAGVEALEEGELASALYAFVQLRKMFPEEPADLQSAYTAAVLDKLVFLTAVEHGDREQALVAACSLVSSPSLVQDWLGAPWLERLNPRCDAVVGSRF